MDKIVVFLSVINLAILEIGSFFFPNHPLMWLAGTSPAYDFVRAFVIILLVALLLTHPPRSNYLRAIVGAVAVIIMSTVLYMTFGANGMMPVLDSVTLTAASIAMGMMALEIPSGEAEDTDYVDLTALRRTKQQRNVHAR